MWSGKESEIPAGWALCDGRPGTPDLRGRFVMGADSSAGDGWTLQVSELLPNESVMPEEKERMIFVGFERDPGPSAGTKPKTGKFRFRVFDQEGRRFDIAESSLKGSKAEQFASLRGKILSILPDDPSKPPPPDRSTPSPWKEIFEGLTKILGAAIPLPGGQGEPDTHKHQIKVPPTRTDTAGDHNHLPPQSWYMRGGPPEGPCTMIDTGGDVNPRQQPTTTNGSHNHTVTVAAFDSGPSSGENRPRWYALCYIIKL
jgi:hypothetical protein